MLKKNILKFIILFTAAMLFIFTGCNNTDKNPDNNPVVGEYTIVFANPMYEVEQYDTLKLIANVKDKKNVSVLNAELSWSVVEGNVEIDETGILIAKAVGTATIKATHVESKASATCKVNVIQGAIPVLEIADITGNSLIISNSTFFNIKPAVSFKGQSYGSEFAFDSSNEAIFKTTQSGKLTSYSTGIATLSVETVWRGIELSKEIEVEVKDTTQLSWEETSKLVKAHEVNNSILPGLSFELNGESTDLSSSNIDYSFVDENRNPLADSPLQIENNLLKTVRPIVADETVYLMAKYSHKNIWLSTSNLFKIEITFDTIVKQGIIDIELDHQIAEEKITYSFSAEKFKNAIGLSDTEDILSIIDRESGNQLKSTDIFTYGSKSLRVITSNNVAYNLDALFVSLIINDAADLDLMGDMLKASITVDGRIQITKGVIETDKMYTDGYFILGNNIDYADEIYTNAPEIFINGQGKNLLILDSQKAASDGYGFEGVFDGRGHTIYNINFTAVKATSKFDQLSRTGLFTAIAKTGIVKNVAFQVNKMGNFGAEGYQTNPIPNTYFGGLAFENYGLIENVSYLVEECHFRTYAGILTMQPGNSNGTYSNITAYVKNYVNYGLAKERNGILVGFARVTQNTNNVYCVVENSVAAGSGVVLEWTWASNGGNDASINFAQAGKDVYRFDSLEDFVAKKSVTISKGVKTYKEDTNMPNTTKFTDYWAMDNEELDVSYGIIIFESTKTLIANNLINTFN